MSKSLGNFITVKEALGSNSPEVLRFFLISSHYRSPLNYSNESIDEARNALDRLYNSIKDLNYKNTDYIKSEFTDRFHNAMKDDFNTPLAISILFEIAKEINSFKKKEKNEEANSLASELYNLSRIIGLLEESPKKYFQTGISVSDEDIQNLISKRNQARLNKDFDLSDKIRDELLDMGITLEDKDTGTIWRKT